jgi:hypothetical protein
MNNSVTFLTALLATAGLATAQTSCNISDCIADLRMSEGACSTGVYKSAMECGAKMFNNTDCQSDDEQLTLAGAMVGMHAGCMMLCKTAAQCPYDGSQYIASVDKITAMASRKEIDCLIGLINCQTSWNKCTVDACTCTERATTCSHAVAAPCPIIGDPIRGIPAALSGTCKNVTDCVDDQCNGVFVTSASVPISEVEPPPPRTAVAARMQSSAAVAWAPIALVAAISALFFAVGN